MLRYQTNRCTSKIFSSQNDTKDGVFSLEKEQLNWLGISGPQLRPTRLQFTPYDVPFIYSVTVGLNTRMFQQAVEWTNSPRWRCEVSSRNQSVQMPFSKINNNGPKLLPLILQKQNKQTKKYLTNAQFKKRHFMPGENFSHYSLKNQ